MFSTRPGDVVADGDVTGSDVLSGKGRGVAAREGNQFYARLIRENKDEYLNRKTVKMKKEVARHVLQLLKSQDPPARFMKGATGDNKVQVWIIQDDKFANKKITQALREKRDRRKEKNKEGDNCMNLVEEEEQKPRSNVKRSLVKITKALTITSCGSKNRTGEEDDYFPQDVGLAREESGPIRKNQKTSSARSFLSWMKTGSSLKLLKSSVGSLSFGSLFGSKRDINSSSRQVPGGAERSPSAHPNPTYMTGISTTSIATTENNDPEKNPKFIIELSKSRMSLIKDSVGSIDMNGTEGQCLKDTEKLHLVKESMEFLSSDRMDEVCESMRSLTTKEPETENSETTEMKRAKFKNITERQSMQQLEPTVPAQNADMKPALNLVSQEMSHTTLENSQYMENTGVDDGDETGDDFGKSSTSFLSTETLPTMNLGSDFQGRGTRSDGELMVGNYEKSSSNLMPILRESDEMLENPELYGIKDGLEDGLEEPSQNVVETNEIPSSFEEIRDEELMVGNFETSLSNLIKQEEAEMLPNPEPTFDNLQNSLRNMSLESSDILFDSPDTVALVKREDSDARMMNEVLELVSSEL